MYLDNHVKLALHLEGYPDPTQAEIEAAVTATGYTGYVSMEYEQQKSAAGGTFSVKPGAVPVPDMINSFNKKQLKEFCDINSLTDGIAADIFKGPLAVLRQAVLEAFRLAEAK